MRVRTLLCGCCTNGCVCADHQCMTMGVPATVCDFHTKHAHPMTDATEIYYESGRELDAFDFADAGKYLAYRRKRAGRLG